MNKRFGILGGLLLATVMLAGMASHACAQDEGYIDYRQAVMKGNGDHLGAIGAILKYKLPYGKDVAAHAMSINALAKMIPVAFKEKTGDVKTDAKPEIWNEWSKFEQKAKDMETASAKLADVAAGGDMAAIGDAVKKLGGTCKGCHDDFRKPKEQSYKNMK